VPLLIHLMPRTDRRIIAFAAMRFVSERDFPRRQWRLHEPLLLALRLLLIATVALLLAAPAWRGGGESPPPWVVVAAGIDAAAARAAVNAPNAEWRRLAAGFPPLDEPAPAAAVTPATVPVASLLRQLDADLPAATALTVVVPRILGGLDAERLQLGRPTQWRVLPAEAPIADLRTAAQPTAIAVRLDTAGMAEMPVVRALAAAWAAAGTPVALDIADSSKPLPEKPGWLIWLGGPVPAAVDAWLRRGGNALASRQAASGAAVLAEADGTAVLYERLPGRGRILSTASALTTDALPMLREPEFPQRLFALLAAPILPPDRAPAASVAPLQSHDRPAGPVRPLGNYLAMLIAALFLGERLLATRQRAAR